MAPARLVSVRNAPDKTDRLALGASLVWPHTYVRMRRIALIGKIEGQTHAMR